MQKFFENDLANAAQHATMRDMKTTRAPMLPTGDRLTVPRLALAQHSATPAHNLRGGGHSHNLIKQRLHFSRAGESNKGLIRAASRLALADRFAGGEISNTAAVAPGPPASASPISPLGSPLSAERFSQPMPRCQQPPLRPDSYHAAAERRSSFKVRDSQTHTHKKERKRQ